MRTDKLDKNLHTKYIQRKNDGAAITPLVNLLTGISLRQRTQYSGSVALVNSGRHRSESLITYHKKNRRDDAFLASPYQSNLLQR